MPGAAQCYQLPLPFLSNVLVHTFSIAVCGWVKCVVIAYTFTPPVW
jgi:hypothetical protein